jgi:hypothetical protein
LQNCWFLQTCQFLQNCQFSQKHWFCKTPILKYILWNMPIFAKKFQLF